MQIVNAVMSNYTATMLVLL